MENNIMEIIQTITYTRPSVDVEFHPPVFLTYYSNPELHSYLRETYAVTGLLDLDKSSKGNNDGRGILSEDGLSSTISLCFASAEARDQYISDSKMLLIDPSIDEYRTQHGITYSVSVNGVVVNKSI